MHDQSPLSWVEVQCPFCFEVSEIAIEADVHGALVQDCEVCCRPWDLVVRRDSHGGVRVDVGEP